MAFYDLTKEERRTLADKIQTEILSDLQNKSTTHILKYFSDEDTYIRKAAYLALGRLYKNNVSLQVNILAELEQLLSSENEKVRQTTINSAGEIGILNFSSIEKLMERGLFDNNHSVRNAVIGSMKKMGEKNPKPTLAFAKRFLHNPDKEIRREICHGIELRGRTHPEDILPLLKELQYDKTARVRNTVIHVIGQISYKKGCLSTVIHELQSWENTDLVEKAIDEIIDVHYRYKDFSYLNPEKAKEYISANFKNQ